MESNENQPDLKLPPFWGNSDLLLLASSNKNQGGTPSQITPRAIYSYIPVIRIENHLTLLDPYEQTNELCSVEITSDLEPHFQNIHEDGDFIVISAISLGTAIKLENSENSLNKLSESLSEELRRGIPLPSTLGKTIQLKTLFNKHSADVISLLIGLEDRLWISVDDNGTVVTNNCRVDLFVPNALA
jgi:hypothetical protein